MLTFVSHTPKNERNLKVDLQYFKVISTRISQNFQLFQLSWFRACPQFWNFETYVTFRSVMVTCIFVFLRLSQRSVVGFSYHFLKNKCNKIPLADSAKLWNLKFRESPALVSRVICDSRVIFRRILQLRGTRVIFKFVFLVKSAYFWNPRIFFKPKLRGTLTRK